MTIPSGQASCDELLVRWQVAEQLALAAEALLHRQLAQCWEWGGPAPEVRFIAQCGQLRLRASKALELLMARNRARRQDLPRL